MLHHMHAFWVCQFKSEIFVSKDECQDWNINIYADCNFSPVFQVDYLKVDDSRVENSYCDLERTSESRIRNSLSIILQGEFYLKIQIHPRVASLVFQSALPVLLFRQHETRLLLRGKTDKQKSLAIDYTKYIFLPFLNRHFGIKCTLDVRKRGLPYMGDGELFITISPLKQKLRCISLLERGEITSFMAIIWNAKQEFKNVGSLKTFNDEIVKHCTRTNDPTWVYKRPNQNAADLHPLSPNSLWNQWTRNSFVRRDL